VVDISRREREAGCNEEAIETEAERLFPGGGRRYANMLPASRFALVVAVRHDGPELSSPAFVYACLGWQGSEYRFAMRPESIGSQSWIDGALHTLVARASAPAARVNKVRLGEVMFSVSTETWMVPEVAPGATIRLTCRMPTCQEPGHVAVLSVRSPAVPCPAIQDHELVDGSETVIGTLTSEAPDGLDFTIATTHLGCRNNVPPHLRACAVHNSTTAARITWRVSGRQAACRRAFKGRRGRMTSTAAASLLGVTARSQPRRRATLVGGLAATIRAYRRSGDEAAP
jgi:hypothetical protein